MINNIGQKIRIFTNVLSVLSIIGYFIMGAMTVAQADKYSEAKLTTAVISAFTMFICGAVLTLFVALLLHGFAEIVDNSTIGIKQNHSLGIKLFEIEQAVKKTAKN